MAWFKLISITVSTTHWLPHWLFILTVFQIKHIYHTPFLFAITNNSFDLYRYGTNWEQTNRSLRSCSTVISENKRRLRLDQEISTTAYYVRNQWSHWNIDLSLASRGTQVSVLYSESVKGYYKTICIMQREPMQVHSTVMACIMVHYSQLLQNAASIIRTTHLGKRYCLNALCCIQNKFCF